MKQTCVRLSELKCMEVVNIKDGKRLGYVSDVQIDLCDGRLLAIIVPGPGKFCGLFGGGEDYIIPWCEIEKIGDDIILVCCTIPERPKEKEKNWFFK
jgi:YlmC/YmxH family sporulation protein